MHDGSQAVTDATARRDTPPAAPVARPETRFRPRRRRRLPWILAALAVAAVGAAVAWTQFSGGTPTTAYVTAAVRRADIEDTTTAIGTLQPKNYVDVGAQVSGQLSKLLVDVGDTVKKGQLLAEIDATVQQARVEADKAQLLNLHAQLDDKEAQAVLAGQDYTRQVNMMKGHATSAQALDSARATLASAKAQVKAIKAQIQNTESTLKEDTASLGYTKIRAPMAGTIVSLTARQGQTLNANQQAPIILRIADLKTMTVEAQVSEADISRLKIGMNAYFTTLGHPDRRWYGKLREILPTPEVVNNVVLYDALFDVPNPKGELMTQMTAQVFFVSAAAKNALVVPIAALKTGTAAGRHGGQRVEVMADDGTVTTQPVKVGIVNRVSAQILDGLKAGERVVVGVRRAAGSSGFMRRPHL